MLVLKGDNVVICLEYIFYYIEKLLLELFEDLLVVEIDNGFEVCLLV